MKAAAFEYHAPRTLGEATDLLARHAADGARVLAGGQSLVPAMALRLATPAHLVDINGIDELKGVALRDGKLVVRACARHAAFEAPVEAGVLGRMLASVVGHIAHIPIRTRGTMCGSLANADPASEWCLVAATLEPELTAVSRRGRRTIAASDWFRGVMTTSLEPDEILEEVRFACLPADTAFAFEEFSRRAGDFALGMALVALRLESGLIGQARIGVGGVEAIPRRIVAAEEALIGRRPSADLYEQAATRAAAEIDPLVDFRYDAGYRRDLARTLVRRALHSACGQVQ